jgi:hypothetical protein
MREIEKYRQIVGKHFAQQRQTICEPRYAIRCSCGSETDFKCKSYVEASELADIHQKAEGNHDITIIRRTWNEHGKFTYTNLQRGPM